MQCQGEAFMEGKAGEAPAAAPAPLQRPGGRGKGKDKGRKDRAEESGPRPVPAPARPRAWAALLAAAVGLAGGAAQGQVDLLCSLSADDTVAGAAVRDQDLVLHPAGMLAHVAWPSETLSLLAGDGGLPLHPSFTDIDAVHDRGGATADEGLLFSITTDEAGFLDGDVIGVGPSGSLEVSIAEAVFVAAVGSTDGNVDLDAFQLDADGTLLFSFGDNEGSAFLSGEDPNVLKDGDVLRLAPGAAAATVLYTEAQVSALVTQALGVASTTVDTLSLARNPQDGTVLFSVQSPTGHDASVFTTAGGGALLAGHAEPDLGFTVGPELDALSVAASRFPVVTTSVANPAPGATVVLGLADAAPGVPHLALVALTRVPAAFPLQGWGGFVLAPDVLLGAALAAAPSLVIVPGGTGTGTLTAVLPLALGPTDVVVQVVAPGPGAAGSNPLLLELAQ
jgi:hypothetical protein